MAILSGSNEQILLSLQKTHFSYRKLNQSLENKSIKKYTHMKWIKMV